MLPCFRSIANKVPAPLPDRAYTYGQAVGLPHKKRRGQRLARLPLVQNPAPG